ncbi:glycosyltransferase family 2 protein [Selenomonas sp. oral taxon 149]|uniref:glycosyltransferase family 2 protein n=1 Tax=Selenomonas sp. oral taxon 149 TaxID=712535 RepID=UPI0001E087B8|nr:glycosyltransferase family 2 protein [Selenomonas sp. oral taxon 149]EFM22944.1 glycosyltransferase, group 2 family protein [Selenomonas sp. oral taxon 149 str. 67H29BP]
MDKITIIVPCYNEAEVIQRFYEAVTAATAAVEDCVFSYLFIDDGSRDGTLDAIRTLADAHDNVRYLSFTRNFGKEPAMMAGLDFADGDAVLIMDADLQHPPALIPAMVAAWRAGYDDVCGKRTDRKDETFLKRTMANFFYRSMQAVSRFTLQRDVGDFRLLDHRCVAALRLLRENQRFTKGLFTWVGFKKKEIPFQVQPRAAGKTTWSYLALLSLAVEGITSFTTAPLRLTTVLGLIVSALALCYMVVVLVDALVYGDPVAGYPTLMTVLLFLGGVQLLSLGIIGEYLGRVFTESKQRPCYLIDELDGEKFDNATLARRRYIDTGE